MHVMTTVFRFYILPALIFIMGCLLSFGAFQYEYAIEEEGIQQEYQFRAEGHMAAVLNGITNISDRLHIFHKILEQEIRNHNAKL